MHLVHDPAAPAAEPISFADFLKVDVRAGTIREAARFPQARNPSYILMIDFGPTLGVRKSAAQITERYSPEDLVGRRVLAVVNFPPRQLGPIRSEVLVLGLADAQGAIVLAAPEREVPNGARLA
ncbi:tRNA-binding protein [Phenylobacterium deserti]|uniref:tRNA-binding protein n=1 Tax=Phenylobacterium deserti TaxID=1914756 RepID=A0A328ADF2_9CAUL|nr:tRNA-binding protein [Phenylobacterium deserti]RAK52615.1 tRNA-binding protein [Phenylobacterium deserti]